MNRYNLPGLSVTYSSDNRLFIFEDIDVILFVTLSFFAQTYKLLFLNKFCVLILAPYLHLVKHFFFAQATGNAALKKNLNTISIDAVFCAKDCNPKTV